MCARRPEKGGECVLRYCIRLTNASNIHTVHTAGHGHRHQSPHLPEQLEAIGNPVAPLHPCHHPLDRQLQLQAQLQWLAEDDYGSAQIRYSNFMSWSSLSVLLLHFSLSYITCGNLPAMGTKASRWPHIVSMGALPLFELNSLNCIIFTLN